MRIVLAAVLVLLLAACGGSDEPDPELNVTISDNEGVTPLEHAERSGYEEIAATLAAAGAAG